MSAKPTRESSISADLMCLGSNASIACSIRSASSVERMPSMNMPKVFQEGFPAPKLALEQSKRGQSNEIARVYGFTDHWVVCGVRYGLIVKNSFRRAQIGPLIVVLSVLATDPWRSLGAASRAKKDQASSEIGHLSSISNPCFGTQESFLFPPGKYIEALDGGSPLWAKTGASLFDLQFSLG